MAKRIERFEQLDDTQICYWKADGIWLMYLPGCGVGNLANHKVEEHEDGTITVHPSILVEGHDKGQRTQKHGFLVRGEWKDA
jgi:hypothetical protein